MAKAVTIKVDGLSALGERMRALGEKTATQFSVRATGKAAALVKKAAKQNLRTNKTIRTGLLEKNVIAKKIPKAKAYLTSEHIVTVKKKIYTGIKGEEVHTRRVGVFMEFGTVEAPAESFLRPALANNLQPSIDAMANSLERDIVKAGK